MRAADAFFRLRSRRKVRGFRFSVAFERISKIRPATASFYLKNYAGMALGVIYFKFSNSALDTLAKMDRKHQFLVTQKNNIVPYATFAWILC